jgi:hypothetical protein
LIFPSLPYIVVYQVTPHAVEISRFANLGLWASSAFFGIYLEDRIVGMNKPAQMSVFFFGAILATGVAIRAFAQQATEQAVLAPILAMFDGMSKRDAAAIKAPTLPGGTVLLMRNGKPSQMTFDAFAERVGKPGTTQIEERIHDPLVRIDNDLAVVWAAFDFRVDGKVDHCGTDLFNLVRVDGRWIIASIADTGTKTCSAQ